MAKKNKPTEKGYAQLEKLLEEAKEEAQYYKRISEGSGKRHLREFDKVSKLVNKLKSTQQSLRESEERFRTIVETAPGLLHICDENGRNLYVSPNCVRITGYTQSELLNKNAWWFLKDDTDREMKLHNRVFRKGVKSGNIDYEAVKKNGDRWYGSSSWAPTTDEEGRIKGFVIQTVDITDQKLAEKELQGAYNKLEKMVDDRTAEIRAINEELRKKNYNLEELNAALRVLLKKREEDKREFEEKLFLNMRGLVDPYLEKLKMGNLGEQQKIYVGVLESNLKDITSPFLLRSYSKHMNFTPMELHVANFIKQGRTTKEIAGMLNLSPRTVESHRENIRKKIGIRKTKANLRTYLLSLE